jgi:hypothetical protein
MRWFFQLYSDRESTSSIESITFLFSCPPTELEMNVAFQSRSGIPPQGIALQDFRSLIRVDLSAALSLSPSHSNLPFNSNFPLQTLITNAKSTTTPRRIQPHRLLCCPLQLEPLLGASSWALKREAALTLKRPKVVRRYMRR